MYKSMREEQGRRVRQNTQIYKRLTKNIRVGCLVWYFDPRIIPGTSHKLRSFWARPYRVSRLIAAALVEIKPVYYPGKEKLVSLDMLKLYCGEDVVQQEPEDVDPDRWLDKGELTELHEASLRARERIYMEPLSGQRNPEISAKPAHDIQIIPEDPEAIAGREKGYMRGYKQRYIKGTRR